MSQDYTFKRGEKNKLGLTWPHWYQRAVGDGLQTFWSPVLTDQERAFVAWREGVEPSSFAKDNPITIMVLGNFEEPSMCQNFIVVRFPRKGLPWRVAMREVKKLIRTWFGDLKARDQRWNIDGEATGQNLWSTKVAARFAWNGDEFVRVT